MNTARSHLSSTPLSLYITHTHTCMQAHTYYVVFMCSLLHLFLDQTQDIGLRVARKKKIICSEYFLTLRLYSVDLSLHWGNLSGNWLWWRKCNLVAAPLLHTVNIFISSEALCRSSSQIAFCVFTNNLHCYKMKHEVYSYTTSLPGVGTN